MSPVLTADTLDKRPMVAANSCEQAVGRLWLAAAGAFVFLRLLVFLPAEVNTFAASHYLFSYADGFHKRALLGTLIGAYFHYLPAKVIYAISLGTLLVFSASLVWFARKSLAVSKEFLVLGLVLLGAPAVLPHFAYSIGYFDPVLVVCALLSVAALDLPLGRGLRLPLALVPCVAGVLIHESYALTAFPFIFARGILLKKPDKTSLWMLAGLVGVATLAMQSFGQPHIPLPLYMAHAASRTDVAVDHDAFELLYFHLQENYAYLAQHYSSVMTDARLFAALLVPIPYFVMLYDLCKRTIPSMGLSSHGKWLVGVSVLAPLFLTLVGFDVLRWVSFACLNLSLLVFECVRTDARGEVRYALTRYVHSPRFWLLALVSFTLGSLHVVDGNGVATGIHAVAHGLGLVRW